VADLLPYLALLALVLVATGAAQLLIGLRPFARIRQRLAAVSQGAARRMGSDLPAEVLPLAAQIDSLLDAAETETDRARARAADLAHGLKTPLQALLGEAGRLQAAGAAEAARGVTEIVDAMQTHVDRELSRARRAADRAQAQALPLTVARAVAGVLMRTPDGAALDWRITGDDLPARIDPADLTEALGALAENAARHAASRVEISCAALDDTRLVVVLRDDGPGVDPADLDRLLQRGVRLDTRGGGLGLSIAAEIAVGAGGGLALTPGDPGLVARLVLLRSAAPGHEAR
jgi:signal transduction histidine kinase